MPLLPWRTDLWSTVKSRLGLFGQTDDDADFKKGVQALNDKDFDLAIACFSAVARRFPKAPEAYYNRGNAYFLKGEYTTAREDYAQAIDVGETFAPAYLARSVIHLLQEYPDEAIADCSDAIRLEPNDAAGYHHRADAYAAKKDYARALTDLTHALRLSPTEATIYQSRGRFYLLRREFDLAVTDFTDAIRFAPNDPNAYTGRAAAFLAKQLYDQAFADVAFALRTSPADPQALVIRGQIYQARKDFAKAREDFIEAVRLDPRAAQPYNALAWLLATCPEQTMRDGLRAIEHARKANELTPGKEAHCLETLAAAYAEAGQFDEAVRRQKEAIEAADPADAKRREENDARLKLFQERKPFRMT